MSTPNPFDTVVSNPFDQLDAAPLHYDITQPVSPTAGMSPYQQFMAGAGKAVVDTGRGLEQIGTWAGNKVGLVSDAEKAAVQQNIDRSAIRDAALMRSPWGVGGDIAGNVAMSVVPATGAAEGAEALGLGRTAAALRAFVNPATIKGATAVGAIQGALQPTTSDQSRAWNIGTGAVGGATGNALAKLPAILYPPEAAARNAVHALTMAGVPLDAAQRSGSTLLSRAKALLSDNPLTAGAQRDFSEMQGRAFTRAVLSTMGEDAEQATPKVMGDAMNRMGAVYDDVASRTNIPYDVIEGPLSEVQNQARMSLNDSQFGVINRNIEDIIGKASKNGGFINGEQFSNVKQTLDKLSGNSDASIASAARDLRQVLNNGLLSSAVADGREIDVQALQRTNQQWGNMRKIEGAIDTNGNGQISPSKLANVFGQKKNRYISVYGGGDTGLANLAYAGKALLPEKLPQSGTIPRALTSAAVMGAPAAAIGTYEGLRTGNWKTGLEYGAGAYLLPRLLQSGINSQGFAGRALSGVAGASNAAVPASTLFGGALQHVPLSSLLGLEGHIEAAGKAKSKSSQ